MGEILILPVRSASAARRRLAAVLDQQIGAGTELGARDGHIRAGARVLLEHVRTLEAQCASLEAWLVAHGIDPAAEFTAIHALTARAQALADLAARFPTPCAKDGVA